MGVSGSVKKVPNYYEKGTRLNVQGMYAFRKDNYMKGIKHIYVHPGTELEEFPTKEMVESKTLKTIYLNAPHIKKFYPGRMSKLNLTELQIKDRSDSPCGHIIHLSNVSVLETLLITNNGTDPVLNNNNRMKLMKKLSGAENLTWLSLEGMHIDKFPREFFEMSKLIKLNLRRNNIIEPSVLDDIYKFENLEDLDLSYNEKLKGLPNSITRLKKLYKLLLFGNKVFETFPKILET